MFGLYKKGNPFMRRTPILLAVLWLGLGLGAAQEQDFSKVQLKVSKVAGNVYMIDDQSVAGEGNVGVCVGDDEIVLVDDQHAPLADKIQTALKSITDKPVRFVVNTHYHEDHTGGNVYFQKQASIIAQDNLRKRMESGTLDGNGATQHFVKPQPKEALPIITFDHDLTLHLNGEDIHVLHFPAAHTDGDSIVFFPKSNVVHMGDIFVTYGFPYIDLDAGGSIDGTIDAMEKVISQLPADVKVIPGHGPISSLDDMCAFANRLKEMRETVQKALDQGKTLDQMEQAKLLDPWKKYAGLMSGDAFLKTLYKSLTGQKNGKSIGN
jgi:cyclase